MRRRFVQLLVFVTLTVLTQIGGIAYLLSLLLSYVLQMRRPFAKLIAFFLLYAAATGLANVIAPAFGRVPVPCLAREADSIVVKSTIYCLLNRNYVKPPVLNLVSALADDVSREFPGTTTVLLDGNFPFWDGFPLLPHLTHADGRKLDIAFYYKDASGNFINRATRSPIGYFAFEQPSPGDEQPCKGRRDILTTRWNFDWLQSFFPAYSIEETRTAFVLRWLSTEGVERFGLEKVFIEPHLRDALGVKNSVIRFQGCRAARHDDHIHIQVK